MRDADGTVTSSSAGSSVRAALADAGTPLSLRTRAPYEAALAHRFGRIPMRSEALASGVTRFRVSEPADAHEREAADVASTFRAQPSSADAALPRVDLSTVRVHAGAAASAAARAVGARAFTVGNHIVFGAGRFDLESAPGQRLLAHELTHVVRGGQGGGAWLQRDAAKEKQITPKDDACEGRLDYTVDFKRFQRDAHRIVRGLPDLSTQEQDELIKITDTVFEPEGEVDIGKYKILACTRINSPLLPPGSSATGAIDSGAKELRISRQLADFMVNLTDGTSTSRDEYVAVLRIFAHELRHVSIGSLVNAREGEMKDQSDPKRKAELVTYRAQEILSDIEESVVSRKALGPSYEVDGGEQLAIFRSANMIRHWAKPDEFQRLRTLILNELRRRYGGVKAGCDNALVIGFMRVIDRGEWFDCDMGSKKIAGKIPEGVKPCEVNGQHQACVLRANERASGGGGK
jgi:hypothetical protein